MSDTVATPSHSTVDQHTYMGVEGAGESGPFIKYVGGNFSAISACAAAAAVWHNTSAPTQRCLSATLFVDPRNSSFAGQCFCLVGPKWFPVPSVETDSARLLWPCTGPEDCSYNGVCNSSTGHWYLLSGMGRVAMQRASASSS